LVAHPDATLRLFCFPWAGGSAHSYAAWRDFFSSEPIELLAISLPGRGARASDPPYTHLPSLVDDLLTHLRPFLTAPFAFFGHSFGSILATEVARALQLRALPTPLVLFVSAHPAPGLPLPPEQAGLSSSSDTDLLEGLSRWDFVPPTVLAEASDPSLSQLVLRAIRADLALREAYCADIDSSLPFPLSSPLHVFVGEDDRSLDHTALEEWRLLSTAGTESFGMTKLAGGHFFLLGEGREELLRILCDRAMEAVRARPPSVIAAQPQELPEWYVHEKVCSRSRVELPLNPIKMNSWKHTAAELEKSTFPPPSPTFCTSKISSVLSCPAYLSFFPSHVVHLHPLLLFFRRERENRCSPRRLSLPTPNLDQH
ncbi:MAG: hypothetical protein SGPRY_002308, partial [Prymnesium sp.]